MKSLCARSRALELDALSVHREGLAFPDATARGE